MVPAMVPDYGTQQTGQSAQSFSKNCNNFGVVGVVGSNPAAPIPSLTENPVMPEDPRGSSFLSAPVCRPLHAGKQQIYGPNYGPDFGMMSMRTPVVASHAGSVDQRAEQET